MDVWTTCNCHNLGDYHDVYLKTDVYLLADVFENFRKTAVSTYQLDPAHYFTLPGFAWDALLKTTGITLELLTDVDMHLFVERGKYVKSVVLCIILCALPLCALSRVFIFVCIIPCLYLCVHYPVSLIFVCCILIFCLAYFRNARWHQHGVPSPRKSQQSSNARL